MGKGTGFTARLHFFSLRPSITSIMAALTTSAKCTFLSGKAIVAKQTTRAARPAK